MPQHHRIRITTAVRCDYITANVSKLINLCTGASSVYFGHIQGFWTRLPSDRAQKDRFNGHYPSGPELLCHHGRENRGVWWIRKYMAG